MPRVDGVAATAQIGRAVPKARVLVLTTYDADHDIVRAVEAGARGVLLKDAPREELFRAIRSVARGDMVLAPTVTARLVGRLHGRSEQVPTDRELEVLGPGRARPDQPGDRPAALAVGGHGQDPPGAPVHQARGGRPDGRGDGCARPRTDHPAWNQIKDSAISAGQSMLPERDARQALETEVKQIKAEVPRG